MLVLSSLLLPFLMSSISCHKTIESLMAEDSSDPTSNSNWTDCASAARRCEARVDCRSALSDFKFYCHVPVHRKDLETCAKCSQVTQQLKTLSLGQAFLDCECQENTVCLQLKNLSRVCPQRVKRENEVDEYSDEDYSQSRDKCLEAVTACNNDTKCQEDLKVRRTITCAGHHEEGSLQASVRDACFFCG